MKINNFISKYKNHPVLFIGTGISLRYLENSYNWNDLLSKIAIDLFDNDRKYLDIKARFSTNQGFIYESIAEELEKQFNDFTEKNPDGKFKDINDIFYDKIRNENTVLSRFKIYISKLLSSVIYRQNIENELHELKLAKKNIGSIITTNYDRLIEDLFEFNPLIGNDILLSNPYGTVYKIHGCINDPSKIIITKTDYDNFEDKCELIRAQLLSLFIHNPIIFLGYSVGDKNIKDILKTIFTYVEPNSKLAKKVRDNFLLVEYEEGIQNSIIEDHDIELNDQLTIRINKIKTNNFIEIYRSIANLKLPMSVMEIRKFEFINRDIKLGDSIKVRFAEDLDKLQNSDMVIAIGSLNTVRVEYKLETINDMIKNYFKIIEDRNDQLIKLINNQKISRDQYFPIYAFSKIYDKITTASALKEQQASKIKKIIDNIHKYSKDDITSIGSIISSNDICKSYKTEAIVWGIYKDRLNLDEVKQYLENNKNNSKDTDYRKILCAYDYKKYKD